jgi:hypothetical protein
MITSTGASELPTLANLREGVTGISPTGRRLVGLPDYLPTGEELFTTGAIANSGGCSDPTNDSLINKTLTSSNPQARVRGSECAGAAPMNTTWSRM